MTGLPFMAVVGQDDARLALLLGAVDPGIGGVLLTGEKGTAEDSSAHRNAHAFTPNGLSLESTPSAMAASAIV